MKFTVHNVVENEHYSTVSGLIQLVVAVTGRKRTLFHCKWANLISYNYLSNALLKLLQIFCVPL